MIKGLLIITACMGQVEDMSLLEDATDLRQRMLDAGQDLTHIDRVVEQLTPVPSGPIPRVVGPHGHSFPDYRQVATRVAKTGNLTAQNLKEGDVLLVPRGVSLTLDQSVNIRLEAIAVEGEVLIGPQVEPLTLVVGGIYLYGGAFDVVTDRYVTIVFDNKVDVDRDPSEWDHGFVSFWGHVHFGGVDTQERFFHSDNSDWREMSWVPNRAVNTVPSDISVSRNIQFVAAEGSDPYHVAFVGDSYVHFQGVQIHGGGRTRWDLPLGNSNKPGRYALHAHHLRHEFVFQDCVVFGKEFDKWNIVHHQSHGTIRDCIVLDAGGAGIAIEEGGESGLVTGCFVEHHRGWGTQREDYNSLDNVGAGGQCYWSCSPFVQFIGNRAEAYMGSGFQLNTEPHVVYQNGLPRMNHAAPLPFAGEVYDPNGHWREITYSQNSMRNAQFEIWGLRTGDDAGELVFDDWTVEQHTAFRTTMFGGHNHMKEVTVRLKNWDVQGPTTRDLPSIALWGGSTYTGPKEVILENCNVEGRFNRPHYKDPVTITEVEQ